MKERCQNSTWVSINWVSADVTKEVKSMLKRVAVALLLVALLAVGAAFSGSQSEEVMTPEEFAAFFEICYRPPAITEEHLRYIDQLPDFGPKTMKFLEEAVPITTVEQLKAVHEIGLKKSFILRALFDLSPDKEPYQTGQEGVTKKIEALETQLQKLLRAIDDLEDDIEDLEYELDELEDRVEQLELQAESGE
jgi:predicted ribosome quality control (RQC) complex YloA/Tae2 family protein